MKVKQATEGNKIIQTGKFSGDSNGIVTGPSFCIRTCMSAPNIPSTIKNRDIIKLNAHSVHAPDMLHYNASLGYELGLVSMDGTWKTCMLKKNILI